MTPRDNQNLIALAKKIKAIERPEMESEEGRILLSHFDQTVSIACEYIKRKAKEQKKSEHQILV